MNPQILVQSLKGSKAHVLLAFIFARAALDIDGLKMWTGLKRQTIYDACDALEAMGLLGTQVLSHGRKLWIPAGAMLPLMNMELQESEKWTPEITATATESLITNKLNTVVVVEDRSPKNGHLGTAIVYDNPDTSFEKNLAACKSKGIGEPKATELSRMPHVTPILIQEHVNNLTKGEKLGLAIIRIAGNEAPRGQGKNRKEELLKTFKDWGVCPSCHTAPCSCDDDDDVDAVTTETEMQS
jgi:hypothetical protein